MKNEIQNFQVLSIGIDADYDKAFAYLADGGRLPEWTNQFLSVDGNKAQFDTFDGVADVSFELVSSREFGTIDCRLSFADGSVGYAYSRLTRNIQGVIYAFNFIVPPMPSAELEKALNRQSDNIKDELSKLKNILEG